MSKAILIIDMPNCCYECFAFDDSGDYPMCLITKECRGYRFRAREEKMDKCPLRPIPKKLEDTDSIIDNEKIENNNHCFDCDNCNIGWGAASTNGITGCHITCEKLKNFKEVLKNEEL